MRIAFLMCAIVLSVAPSAAQNEPPRCDGDITILRVSKIKPGGTDGFMKAVEAHRAFYRANGVEDNEIVTARVIVRDQATGDMSYAEDQVLSLHIRPPYQQNVPGRGDAAYDAFVKHVGTGLAYGRQLDLSPSIFWSI